MTCPGYENISLIDIRSSYSQLMLDFMKIIFNFFPGAMLVDVEYYNLA